MDTQRAHQLIDQLLAEDFKKLDDVHFRYFVFAGLVEGFDNDEQCIKDRADYAHLVPERLNGLPHVEEEKMAEFMHAVSGCNTLAVPLPRQLGLGILSLSPTTIKMVPIAGLEPATN